MRPLKFTAACKQVGTVRKLSGTKYWVVDKPFVWYVDYLGKKGKIVIPKGFKTDFGSIPRVLWVFLNPTEWVSFILHDYLYSKKKIEGKKIKRNKADLILAEALAVEGCGSVEVTVIYLGVFVGGWYGWHFLHK